MKWGKVFVVLGSVCGGGEGWRLGGLGRWSRGECLGKVWGEEAACGAGNFWEGRVGSLLESQRVWG